MLRPASQNEAETVVAIQAAAFGFANSPAQAERYASLREELSHGLQDWLLFEYGGRPVGAVRVLPQRLRIGRAVVRNADIGGVAILPELHGRGLGTQMMQETMQHIRDSAFATSRLGGLARFYERFGYVRFPRRYVEIKVGQSARAGALTVQHTLSPLPPDIAAHISPYNPARHAQAWASMAESFLQRYSGSPVIAPTAAPGAAPLSMVFEDDDRLLGYFRARLYDSDRTEFEAELTVGEFYYDIDRPDVLRALILHLAWIAREKGIGRITLRLPFDPVILDALCELPIFFQTIQTYGGLSSNMMQVVSVRNLLEALRPELEARLDEAPPVERAAIRIEVECHGARLLLDGRSLLVEPDGPAQATLNLSHRLMVEMALGLVSFHEVMESGLTESLRNHPAALNVLRILFPRRLVFSGVWG